jgi:hypothetical protein
MQYGSPLFNNLSGMKKYFEYDELITISEMKEMKRFMENNQVRENMRVIICDKESLG